MQNRFVAEHGSDLNIERLEVGRELLVDDIGTVTLPPDILLRLGGSGGYTVAELEPGRLTLIGETIDVGGELVLAGVCPACKHEYDNDTEQECPSCGSSRPMVEA